MAPVFSAERLYEIVDKAVEISIALPKRVDLANRVNDRRMVFAAEALPDLRQRGIRQRLAQIHGNLARQRH
jgi:hypothetical protein